MSIMAEHMLNNEQDDALRLAQQGHNLIIVGAAGTGKSYLIKSLLKLSDRQVAVTCSTGIACSVYPSSMNVMTIHKWSGIGDGRFLPSEISEVIKNNPIHKPVKDIINSTDMLIIDECSMISCKFIESLILFIYYTRFI